MSPLTLFLTPEGPQLVQTLGFSSALVASHLSLKKALRAFGLSVSEDFPPYLLSGRRREQSGVLIARQLSERHENHYRD